MAVAAGLAAFVTSLATSGPASAEDRALKLLNVHTNEKAVIVFKRNGRYDSAGLTKINNMLRDWRKNQPTRMDPQLMDLIWEVYRKSGSSDYIHVVCGYRSPETNGMLRRRSRGVAKNSQHVQGKAMDFFIPGVPLATLRAIGLRMQLGGVGYYPTSGSPFVHMDTGSVRHWPKMTRQQLVSVFPNGKTLHVPSDGKPLPGYAEALAAYKARKSGSTTAIASLYPDEPVAKGKSKAPVGEPIVLASADEGDDDDAPAAPLNRARPVTVASAEVPVPRPSPRLKPGADEAVASEAAASEEGTEADDFVAPKVLSDTGVVLASLAPVANDEPLDQSGFEFDSNSHWGSTRVPANLASAMAARDITRRPNGASVPIPPTAVVSTIDVTRPLRAEAMTTAVLRGSTGEVRQAAAVMAYAPANDAMVPVRRSRVENGIPVPVTNPLRVTRPTTARLEGGFVPPRTVHKMASADLTLTQLDTQGLRIWIGSQSTRQRNYALLTMPDFSQQPALLDKPQIAFAAGFGDAAYRGLRTDRFSGPVSLPPRLIDLVAAPEYALR